MDGHAARQELQVAVLEHPRGDWRVRLLLDVGGGLRTEAQALAHHRRSLQLRLADRA